MKRITFFIIAMLIGISGFSQNDVITKLFNQYYDNENFTKVSVSSKMFELFNEIESGDEDEEEILEAISKLEGLKVLATDSIENPRAMFDNAVQEILSNKYEELMEVKDADEDMKFMILEKGSTIKELVMVIGGKKNFVIISLYGEIDLKNISKLSKSMSIKGMEHLKHVEKHEKHKKAEK